MIYSRQRAVISLLTPGSNNNTFKMEENSQFPHPHPRDQKSAILEEREEEKRNGTNKVLYTL